MADDGCCWWNPTTAAASAAASCSMAISDVGATTWTSAGEGIPFSATTASSSATFPTGKADDAFLSIGPHHQIDWTQAIIGKNGGGGDTANFQVFLEDEMNGATARAYGDHQDESTLQTYDGGSGHVFLAGGLHRKPPPPVLYNCPPTVQGLLGSIYDDQAAAAYDVSIGASGLPQFLSTPSPSPAAQKESSSLISFLDASAAAAPNEVVISGFYPPSPPLLLPPSRTGCGGTALMASSAAREDQQRSSAVKVVRTAASCGTDYHNQPVLKKIRLETPSPLPTFKVRKEKLGDRITALQQLVSPFGKTDTASVLQEAIDYIKVLHDQVAVLTSPYMENGGSRQRHKGGSEGLGEDGETQKDLRSRGLCLMPVASTYPVAGSGTTVDFWHPSFGGAFIR